MGAITIVDAIRFVDEIENNLWVQLLFVDAIEFVNDIRFCERDWTIGLVI